MAPPEHEFEALRLTDQERQVIGDMVLRIESASGIPCAAHSRFQDRSFGFGDVTAYLSLAAKNADKAMRIIHPEAIPEALADVAYDHLIRLLPRPTQVLYDLGKYRKEWPISEATMAVLMQRKARRDKAKAEAEAAAPVPPTEPGDQPEPGAEEQASAEEPGADEPGAEEPGADDEPGGQPEPGADEQAVQRARDVVGRLVEDLDDGEDIEVQPKKRPRVDETDGTGGKMKRVVAKVHELAMNTKIVDQARLAAFDRCDEAMLDRERQRCEDHKLFLDERKRQKIEGRAMAAARG